MRLKFIACKYTGFNQFLKEQGTFFLGFPYTFCIHYRYFIVSLPLRYVARPQHIH